ncbi:MAG: phage scaffolding protein [Clostridiales bacterium]|nr:phage scaffolding protein [Clostridiales bacterium]
MNKEDLIAMGCTEEQAGKIMAALDGNYVTKARFNEVNEENKTLKTTVSERDKQLNTLKESAGDNEELKKQIKDLQDSNKAELKKHADEMKELRLTNAIKLAVTGKVHDEDMAAGLFDRTKLVLTEDGKVAGLEEQLKTIQETKSFLFKEIQKTPPYTPAGGKGAPASNPFAKDTFNLTEQGKLLRENPAQARELAAAAGVKI